MENVNNFDAKFFEIKLKNNWQLKDFLNFFDMTENEFFNKLETIFSSKTYKGLVRRIQRNGKKSTAEGRKANIVVSQASEEIKDIVNEVTQDTIADVFEQLKKLESEKKSAIEIKDKSLTKKQEVLARIDQAKKALEDIQKAIKTQEGIIQSCNDKLLNLDRKVADIEERREALDREIEKLLEKKKELEKVSIMIYGDSIECEVPVPENWRDLYNRITTIEENVDEETEKLIDVVDMMNLKMLRVFSRILSIADVLEKKGKSYKIVFDEESELAVAFQMLECFEIEIIE